MQKLVAGIIAVAALSGCGTDPVGHYTGSLQLNDSCDGLKLAPATLAITNSTSVIYDIALTLQIQESDSSPARSIAFCGGSIPATLKDNELDFGGVKCSASADTKEFDLANDTHLRIEGDTVISVITATYKEGDKDCTFTVAGELTRQK